jgi:hypothetical protein
VIFVPCEYCQREGRILRERWNPWKQIEEIDHGQCPECRGACVIEVETFPITADECAANGD